MTLASPRVGLNWVGAFQVSGLPWVTGSSVTNGTIKKWEFETVSKSITVRNVGPGVLKVGFTLNGVQLSNNFELPASSSQDFDVRVKDLYVQGKDNTCNYFILGEMTNISRTEFPYITGSFITGSNESHLDGVG